MKTSKSITAIILGFLLAATATACSGSTPTATPAGTTPAAASSPTPAPAPTRLRVADLMATAACTGDVIGTQLYSYETGRCMLAGAEVTIAVFDTPALRDQWLAFAKDFGGSFVAGDGWAAGVDKPDQAATLAAALGGKVV